MMALLRTVSVALAVIVFVVQVRTANAAEVKALCAVGMQDVMTDLAPVFERATGHKLTITFATGGATVRRARDGEAIDVIIAPSTGVDSLAKDGKLATANVAAVARTGISVAVRKGAPRPDISSPQAFKRTLLAAKSITYLNPSAGGASGIHFAKVLDQLGIHRAVVAAGCPVSPFADISYQHNRRHQRVTLVCCHCAINQCAAACRTQSVLSGYRRSFEHAPGIPYSPLG